MTHKKMHVDENGELRFGRLEKLFIIVVSAIAVAGVVGNMAITGRQVKVNEEDVKVLKEDVVEVEKAQAVIQNDVKHIKEGVDELLGRK